MEYSNLFYFNELSNIGGTEQFLYEIAKKYHQFDITVLYDAADREQLQRLKKKIRCVQRETGKVYKCKKAFFNYNISPIDSIDAEEYIFVAHTNYLVLGSKPPIDHPKLTGFIGVSQFSVDKLKEYAEKIGLNIEVQKCYNPLTLEPVQKVPIIISACRLSDNIKGGERTIKLINALDRYCKQNNRQYLWLIFTNPPTIKISSPNVIYMQPRIDIRPYIAMADWLAQLSDDAEVFCYTTNEANGYGVPIITTPLTVYNEFEVTDNERIVLDWDCSNVDEIARLIFEKKVKKFKYNPPADTWDKILVNSKSNYKEERKMKVKVRCVRDYYDLEINKLVRPDVNDVNYERIISRERAEEIIDKTSGAIEIIETIKEVKETADKPKKATSRKQPKKEKATI